MAEGPENPTPCASRPSPVLAWELATGDTEEDDFLRDLASVERLSSATTLRLSVNTASTSVSHLGAKLPMLQELNLTGSVVESIRDLGTGFRALQVLWVARCGLPSLDGIAALPALRELYAAFNDISDLQPLADSCPQLEVLDVEDNCVEDVEALHALAACCPRLQSLTLAGNPIAAAPGYRQQVTTLLAGLATLDDEDVAAGSSGPEHDGRASGRAGRGFERAGGSLGLSQCATAGPASSSSPSGSGQDPQELQLVREGIKHARVGVDSQEFRELEMTLLMAAELPLTAAADAAADVAAAASVPGGAATSMLPSSAGSWLRCSQQGSLPSMQRLRSSMRSGEGGLGGSGSPRTSAGSSSSAPPSGGGGGGGPCSRPESSGSPRGTTPSGGGGIMGAAGSPRLQRLSSSCARPPSSARPGTASFMSNRPSTSAPPTASVVGGLYWRKNRLGSMEKPRGSAGGAGGMRGAAGSGGGDDEDDGETAGSSLLTFGVSKEATMGGSLAKDLRQRRKQAGGSGSGGGSGGAATGLLAGSSSLPGAGHAMANGAAAAAAPGPASSSYDSASLLEELRRWKVETADRVLLPPEDETSSGLATWPNAEEDDEGEEEEEAQQQRRRQQRGGSRAPAPWEGASSDVRQQSGGGLGPDVLLVGSGATEPGTAPVPVPAGSTRPGRGPAPASPPLQAPPLSPSGRLLPAAAASPSGKPPLAPLVAPRNGKLTHSASDSASRVAAGGASLSPRPSGGSTCGGGGSGSAVALPQLGPVQGHKPARPSKMLLCKVLFDNTGRVLLTNHHSRHSVSGSGQESLSIKSRPGVGVVGGIDPFQATTASHANPLFAADAAEAGDAEAAGRRVRISSCTPEIDLRSVNPTPVMRIDDGDSSDEPIDL